jgi:hypothetical protein
MNIRPNTCITGTAAISDRFSASRPRLGVWAKDLSPILLYRNGLLLRARHLVNAIISLPWCAIPRTEHAKGVARDT